MARKKKRGKSGPGVVVAALAVLLFLSLALLRFLASERGDVFLLDLGFDGRFEVVRGHLEERVASALAESGMRAGGMRLHATEPADAPGPVRVWRATLPPGASLAMANERIDEALAAAGGRVIDCREKPGGGLAVTVGTRRAATGRYDVGVADAPRAPEPERRGPTVAIVIDDFGYRCDALVDEFLAVPVPLTITVIPGLRHSGRVCRKAAAAGKEILCHLPMEPERGADDDGEIPLVRVDMDEGEIRRIVAKALESTPGAAGINNHMGSKATADRYVMRAVLAECRARGLFFLDSVTSARSIVAETAAELGVFTAANDIFIDNRGEDERDNLRKLLSLAKRRGRAVGIMHVRRSSLEQLRWFVEEASRNGIRFGTASEMIRRRDTETAEGGQR
ncbi:MAG: divergent polysaccharide deacetylase family protein [Candidatus Krumholzibacteriota bacterium]|nr:divergent polysaccharide deacetylase family protein [Candidatus Krumholzibacteriota bacterium]